MVTSPMLVARFVAAISAISLLTTTLANPIPDPWMRKTIRGPHFNIEYQCNTTATEYCTDALAPIRSVAEEVGTALNLTAPLNMFIQVIPDCPEDGPFPKEEDRCVWPGDKLVFNIAEVPVHNSQDNLTYLYPSSLIRQLDIPGKDRLALPQFDIYWRLPAGRLLFEDNALAFFIGRTETENFNHTVFRSIMRGLGFAETSDGGYFDMDGILIWSRKFNKGAPTVTSYLEYKGGTPRTGFAPPTVWDQHVTWNGSRLVEFYKRFTECREAFSNTTHVSSTLREALEKDPCVNPIAKEYYQATIVNNAYMKFSDSNLEPIYTGEAVRDPHFRFVLSIDPLAISAMRVLGYGSHNSSNKDIFIEPSALDNQAIQLASYMKFSDE